MKVEPQNVMASLERDPLAMNDMQLAHKFLPVGFYYKTLIKPRWLWPRVEPMIRKVAGLGKVDKSDLPRHLERVYRHPDVVVLGARPGRPGRGARRRRGRRERDRGRRGRAARQPPRRGRDARRRRELLPQVEAQRAASSCCATHRAFGLYEGPEVPLIGPDLLVMTQPKAIVVATGAFESMEVFPGNDVPGVMLGRGAVRLATQHAIRPGNVAVVLGGHARGRRAHRRAAGASAPRSPPSCCPTARRARPTCRPACARSSARSSRCTARSASSAVSVRYTGGTEKIECDLLCLSGSFTPQENLLRQGTAMPVHAAGDLLAPAPVARVRSRTRARSARAPRAARAPSSPSSARRRGAAATAATSASARTSRCRTCATPSPRASPRPSCSSATRRSRWAPARAACATARCARSPSASRPAPSRASRGTTTARPPARTVMLDEVTAGAVRAPRAAHRRCTTRTSASARTFLWAGQWKRVDNYGSIEQRVPRGARGRRHHRRRHARQVPRLRARRRRVPRAPLPEPRRRHPGRAPALRPAARRARRDPRRRHDLPHRRRDLLPHGHDVGRRGGRGADDRLARHLGHDGAHRQPDLRARRDQRRRPEGARGARDADRGRHLARRASPTSASARSRSPASRASRSASASSARSAGSCTTPRRAPRSCGPR